MVDRIWLDVPYAEKDRAKKAGARWDPAAKRWYAPRKGMTALEPWAAAPDVPDLLPGEDRTLGQGLFVDLVPSSCWFTNVRSCVTPRDWERLRRMITRRAGMQCEACGAGEDREAKRVRLDTAHGHILLSDRATRDDGLVILDQAAKVAAQYGLVHQLRSIEGVKAMSAGPTDPRRR